MDRRKFIKTSMCLGCGAIMLPASQSSLLPEISSKFSKDKFFYKRKEDLPAELRIEACSLCQLNCPGCCVRPSERLYSKSYKFGYLKFSDFRNLIDDNPQLKSIELSNNGEIFLNPELDKIIEYAYKKNVDLTAYNGVNLNDLSDYMAELLVKCKFKRLVVSIDGATPETYKIYRVGGDFNKVISNIKKIQKYKTIYNSEYPELVWKFIVFGHNEHEIDLAKQRAKQLNLDIYFGQNTSTDFVSPIKNKEIVYKKTGIISDEDMWANKLKNNEYYYCYQLFESPQINFDGQVIGCCVFQPKAFDSNVFKDGLLNALNSKSFIDAKHTVTNLSYKPKTDNPCKNCYFYKNVLRKENICISKYA